LRLDYLPTKTNYNKKLCLIKYQYVRDLNELIFRVYG
jgi:hypothetical protein